MSDLIPFNAAGGLPALPAHLQHKAKEHLAALAGGVAGTPINRVSIKGARFRLNQGNTETMILKETFMDAVIVASAQNVSRIYFKDKYDPNAPKKRPTCWSHTGVSPAADVPAEQRQANACASCPQNVKGSAADGSQARACAFKKHIVVVPPSDLEPGKTPVPYLMDLNGQSIYATGRPAENLFSLAEYTKFLQQPRTGMPNGIAPPFVVTRIHLDMDSSTPKLFFQAVAFLGDTMIDRALELGESDDVKRLLELSEDEEMVGVGSTTAGAAQRTVAPEPTPAPPPPPKLVHWTTRAVELELDADDIELIESLGGPGTEKGAKRWAKLTDNAPLDGLDLSNGGTSAPPAAAPAPVAPPPPPPKKPWKQYATELQADADDIEAIENAGGPGTEKGAKLWGKLIGAALGDDIELGNEEKPKAGRGRPKKSEPAPAAAPSPAAQPSAAPAPATTSAPSPATPSAPTPAIGGVNIAKKLADFDD